MDRRRFIAVGSAVLAAHRLPLKVFAGGAAIKDNRPATVFQTSEISPASVSALIAGLGGMDLLLPKERSRSTVLIKPNLCLPDSERQGTTTSTSVIDLFCARLISDGVKRIVIADHTLRRSEEFRGLDLFELERKYQEVKIVLANEERLYQPTAVDGKVMRTVATMRMLQRADLFINLATAKHHSATHVSLGVKNLMGCIWNRSAFHTEMDLAQAIGDLAIAIRPTITVIDAGRVLLNGGPTGPGPVATENRLFASTDILAVDAVVASRYPFGGKSLAAQTIPHLVAAYNNGVGEIDLEKIELRTV